MVHTHVPYCLAELTLHLYPIAAAADEGDFGEEAFHDEDCEDLSVSSGENLAPRGQVCSSPICLSFRHKPGST